MVMFARVVAVVVAFATNWVGGCGYGCTDVAYSGVLTVIVRDNKGAPVCGATATASLPSDPQTYPFSANADCTYSGLSETAGVFHLNITRDGFLPKTMDVEMVKDDHQCHVLFKSVTVDLQPVPKR